MGRFPVLLEPVAVIPLGEPFALDSIPSASKVRDPGVDHARRELIQARDPFPLVLAEKGEDAVGVGVLSQSAALGR